MFVGLIDKYFMKKTQLFKGKHLLRVRHAYPPEDYIYENMAVIIYLKINKLLNNLVNYIYLFLYITFKSISTKRNNKLFISSILINTSLNKKIY